MTIRRLPIPAAVAGIVAFVLLAGTGAASASWSTASLPSTTTVAGATIGTTITGSSTLATQYRFAGSATASPTIVSAISVKNTGTAPLSYSLAVGGTAGNALAPNVGLTLWTSGTTTCAATIPSGGTTVGTLAAPPALPAGATTAQGGTGFTLCAATRLNQTVAASQGQTVTPTFGVTGVVGGSWTTTASDAAFTQSVYQVPNGGAVGCAAGGNLFNRTVTLSWAAPTTPGSVGPITYRVIDQSTGAVVVTAQTGRTAVIDYFDLDSSPDTFLVQTLEGQYGTTSPGQAITVTGNTTIFGLGVAVNCP